MSITLDQTHARQFLTGDAAPLHEDALQAVDALRRKTGRGSDCLGWMSLPLDEDSKNLCDQVQATADLLRQECRYVVCVGIGGSYLGGKAVIEALGDPFSAHRPGGGCPHILFAGQNMSSDYLGSLMRLIADEPFGIVNISKSGTTTEPAIAFRLLSRFLIRRDGIDTARRRIAAVTDRERGALRALAHKEGYTTFVIPDDVGGRFSILTPVGLLPMAIAGINISALMRGAGAEAALYRDTASPLSTPAVQYAMMRQGLYRQGFKTEALTAFEPCLSALGQWWMQLFGESEGKEHRGILPLSLSYTTDLHSMGQWIQQGERSVMETMVVVQHSREEILIPADEQNLDGLNYLSTRSLHHVNDQARIGTLMAHSDGGVPVQQIFLTELSEETLGAFIYTMEYAVAVSGYMMGVNPFDQPGVEEYKRNMFALLSKPGFEQETREIRRRLSAVSQ